MKSVISLPIRFICNLFLGLWEFLLIVYCYRTTKLYFGSHLTIGAWKCFKRKTVFPHPVGVVIGMKVELGYNCIIYQNVTIGTKDTENYLFANYPRIGNNVTIFPNALIIGDVTIGDNSIIGAGSVVLKDVPANSVCYGNPAKSRPRGEA